MTGRPPQVQIFYNPAAGGFCAHKLERLADAFARNNADVVLTPSTRETPKLAPLTTHVCVFGGDGTVRHVAAMLAATNPAIPLAISPSGTVNLLARDCDADRRPTSIADRLLHGGKFRPHRPVACGGSMFFACASAGPDSAAVAGLSLTLKARIGRLAYLASLARLLSRWPRPRFSLRANGQVIACEAVYVAKSPYFAGPWSFAPQASVSNDAMHVVALRRARRRDFFSFCLWMVLKRDPATHPNVAAFTCSTVAIDNHDAFPIQADGDIVGSDSVVFTTHPQAIAIC